MRTLISSGQTNLFSHQHWRHSSIQSSLVEKEVNIIKLSNIFEFFLATFSNENKFNIILAVQCLTLCKLMKIN